MNWKGFSRLFAISTLFCATTLPAITYAADKPPNIVVIMGDDIGWSNIGVYNQGMMAGRTPNLDMLAAEGMRFTDIIMQRPAAQPGEPISLLASYRFVPA